MLDLSRFDHWSVILLLLSHLIISTCIANTTEINPVAADHSLPVMLGAGLSPARPSGLVEAGAQRYSATASLQSHANDAGAGDESLIIDGETHSLRLRMDWGFAESWQASMALVGTRITRGNLDSLINKWHDLLSLDGGDRRRQPQDQLVVQYKAAQNEHLFLSSETALSTWSVSLARQLINTGSNRLALHATANLPTGRSYSLIVSEHLDLALELAASARLTERVGLHGNVAYISVGDDNLFGIETKSSVWQGSLGAHWVANEKWRWTAQLDHRSSLFNSGIQEINQAAWQLAIAGAYQHKAQGPTLQLYFTEDINVNHSADFSIGLRVMIAR